MSRCQHPVELRSGFFGSAHAEVHVFGGDFPVAAGGVRERKFCETPRVVDQDVKSVVVNARLCGAKVLQQIEIRPPVWTESYHFSVEHSVVRKVLQCRCNVGELLVEHVLAAGIERRFAATPHDLKAISVQFDFVSPLRPLREP